MPKVICIQVFSQFFFFISRLSRRLLHVYPHHLPRSTVCVSVCLFNEIAKKINDILTAQLLRSNNLRHDMWTFSVLALLFIVVVVVVVALSDSSLRFKNHYSHFFRCAIYDTL